MSQMFDCKYLTFQKLGEQLADEENKETGECGAKHNVYISFTVSVSSGRLTDHCKLSFSTTPNSNFYSHVLKLAI